MFDFQWLTRWLVSLGKNYYRLVIVCLLNCDLDLGHDRDYHGFLTFFCVCDHEILKNYKKVAEKFKYSVTFLVNRFHFTYLNDVCLWNVNDDVFCAYGDLLTGIGILSGDVDDDLGHDLCRDHDHDIYHDHGILICDGVLRLYHGRHLLDHRGLLQHN